MKRLLILPLLFISATVWGATVYVDNGCPTPGNGTGGYTSTCDGTAAGNPAVTVTAGVAAMSAGDTLSIRGIHAAHGSCAGSTTGIYDQATEGNEIAITKVGSAGNLFTIQNEGYSGTLGSGETVWIEGIKPTTSGWTRCSVCNSGTCDGVTGTCNEVWYYTLAGQRLYFARKADASMTKRKQCAQPDTAAQCNARITSTYDAVSDRASSNWDGDSGETLLVRWGPTVSDPNATAGVAVNNGRTNIMTVKNTSAYVTIQGLGMRNGGRASVEVDNAADHISILNNTMTQFSDSQAGSARPITTDSTTNFLIQGNDISYSSSEPLHISTLGAGTTTGTISGNYIHDVGDPNVMGDGTGGTANCTTFTSDSGVTGDMAGVIVENNLFVNCWKMVVGGSGAKGILFENYNDNMIVRNNILSGVGVCFKWGPATGGHTSGHQVYNNLCIAPGTGAGTGGDGDCFIFRGAGTAANNVVYNNTCTSPAFRGLESDNEAGYTGNLFRNNILSTATLKAVDFPPTDATNHFDNNLVTTTANPAVTWGATSYACSALDTLGTGNIKDCPDPAFVSASNFHIQAASPAKDKGTATGMPAGRTKDICNSIANAHGLVSYNDCATVSGTPDIGTDESAAANTAPKRTLLKVGNMP